jgi:hypothetical protein
MFLHQSLVRFLVGALPSQKLARVSLGTVGRQKEQGEPRLEDQPWLHGIRLVTRIVVDHDKEPRLPLSRIALMEDVQEVAAQGIGLTWAQAV